MLLVIVNALRFVPAWNKCCFVFVITYSTFTILELRILRLIMFIISGRIFVNCHPDSCFYNVLSICSCMFQFFTIISQSSSVLLAWKRAQAEAARVKLKYTKTEVLY